MIFEEKCYGVKCDRCNKVFQNYNGFSVFVDKNDALEESDNSDWKQIDKKNYCPDCVEYDEDSDDYVVKD